MKLNKKQKIITLALSIVTLIFLSAYPSIFFTSHTTLFRVRAELNGASSPQIRAYYNNILETEPNIKYTIKIKIRGYGAMMYIYDPVDTRYSYRIGNYLPDDSSNPKSISVDFTGEIDRIAISTWTSIHVVFTLEVRIDHYKIDWIYGTLIGTYFAIFVSMVFLLGKYTKR